MISLVEFLRARHAEVRAAAEAAGGGSWRLEIDGDCVFGIEPDVVDTEGGALPPKPAVARHIVRHDPARVLAQVVAGERILDLYELLQAGARGGWPGGAVSAMGSVHRVVTLLAAVHHEHPDYDESWKP